jgi:hypothetical protein
MFGYGSFAMRFEKTVKLNDSLNADKLDEIFKFSRGRARAQGSGRAIVRLEFSI